MKKLVYIILALFGGLLIGFDSQIIFTNLQNDAFRIDIIGKGNVSNIKVLSNDSSINVSYPKWCKDCAVLSGSIRDINNKPVSIKFQTLKNNEVSISLKGKDFRKNKIRIPLYVKYTDLVVDGSAVRDLPNVVWHDKPHNYKMSLKGKQVVEFTVFPKQASIFSLFGNADFNFWLFLMGACLTFGICFVIDRFIKKYGHVLSSDVILVFVFGVLLFIPMLHISDAEKSETENRVLATKPELFVDNGINEKYGIQFESWFNDRFNGRDAFIGLYNSIKYNLSDTLIYKGRYINKRHFWIMSSGNSFPKFSDAKLGLMVKNVEKLKKFASAHNIKFYIMIAPSKNSMYGEKYLPYYNSQAEQTRINQVIDYVKTHSGVDVIYPYQELLDVSKNEMTFFKTDHHWTDVGAFVAYDKLMQYIKKDLPHVKVLTENDFNYFNSNKVRVVQSNGLHDGREYTMLNLNDNRFFDVNYKYFEHKSKDKLVTNILAKNEENYIIRDMSFDGNKYNLTLFGDSFGENLEPIIPYSFKNTLRIYTWVPIADLNSKNLNIKRFEKRILDNKTHVLVIVFSEIDRLMYLYKD